MYAARRCSACYAHTTQCSAGHFTILAVFMALSSTGVNAQTSRDRDPASSKSSNETPIIAVAVSISLLILILALAVRYKWDHGIKRRHRVSATVPVMSQTTPVTSATTSTPRAAIRPRRQASTVTVPEYTLQALDEEMVLDKAEPTEVDIVQDITEDSISTNSSNESPALHVTPPRPSFNISHVTLHDIEPAPELRIHRYDTSISQADSSMTSSENAHLLSRFNASSVSLDTTIEDVALDGMPPLSSSRRGSGASFFESPVYTNRSRSRSFDVSRNFSLSDDDHDLASLSRPSLDIPRETHGSSGFRSLFRRPSTNQGSASLLPLHSSPSNARREALRNRGISAPLADTLVRASYQPPKAGLNPLQAAWLGSRDAISRITTYLDTTPPAFTDTAEDDEAGVEGGNEDEEAGVDGVRTPRPPNGRTMIQLEEESAQLSSLVQRASMRRVSLPPHLIALPPSLPASPTSYDVPMDWPARRQGSIHSELSQAKQRKSTDLTTSPVRRHVSSASYSSLNTTPRKKTKSDPTELFARPDSPTPLTTVKELSMGSKDLPMSYLGTAKPLASVNSISTYLTAEDGQSQGQSRSRLPSNWSISTYATAATAATVTASPSPSVPEVHQSRS